MGIALQLGDNLCLASRLTDLSNSNLRRNSVLSESDRAEFSPQIAHPTTSPRLGDVGWCNVTLIGLGAVRNSTGRAALGSIQIFGFLF